MDEIWIDFNAYSDAPRESRATLGLITKAERGALYPWSDWKLEIIYIARFIDSVQNLGEIYFVGEAPDALWLYVGYVLRKPINIVCRNYVNGHQVDEQFFKICKKVFNINDTIAPKCFEKDPTNDTDFLSFSASFDENHKPITIDQKNITNDDVRYIIQLDYHPKRETPFINQADIVFLENSIKTFFDQIILANTLIVASAGPNFLSYIVGMYAPNTNIIILDYSYDENFEVAFIIDDQ